MWWVLLACSPDTTDSAAPTPRPEDSAPAPRTCEAGAAPDLPAPTLSDEGTSLRVVAIPMGEGAAANVLVSWSPQGVSAWAEGAPVVVTLPPAHKVDLTWNLHPTIWYGPDVGVIEVQPVWPGWTVLGVSAGTFDAGGPASGDVLDAALAFVTGGRDVEGHSLADHVNVPVCTDSVALLTLSSGGTVGTAGLATHGAAYADAVVGLTLYEPPSLPEFIVAESGAIWMDPDVHTDADGDGTAWDDGRNLSLDEASCAVGGCTVDYASVTWTPDRALSDLWDGYDSVLPRGVFYFDRDGSGALELDADGYTDLDGSGAVDLDEDTYSRPLVLGAAPEVTILYTPGLTRAAEAAAVGRWPPFVADSATAEAFWADRDMSRWAAPLAAALPDARFSVVYTATPHGPALVTRPGERILHDSFVEAKVWSRYQFSVGAARCFNAEAFADYTGPPPDGVPVEPDAMPGWAILDKIGTRNIQAVGPLDQLQDARGAFDHCPGEAAQE